VSAETTGNIGTVLQVPVAPISRRRITPASGLVADPKWLTNDKIVAGGRPH
jgi:hypothetical protein